MGLARSMDPSSSLGDKPFIMSKMPVQVAYDCRICRAVLASVEEEV